MWLDSNWSHHWMCLQIVSGNFKHFVNHLKNVLLVWTSVWSRLLKKSSASFSDHFAFAWFVWIRNPFLLFLLAVIILWLLFFVKSMFAIYPAHDICIWSDLARYGWSGIAWRCWNDILVSSFRIIFIFFAWFVKLIFHPFCVTFRKFIWIIIWIIIPN